MTPWRVVLFACVAGLVVSAARPAASSPVDVEGTTYGGTASGGWACGPDARAKYGGVGGEIRARPFASPDAGAGETGPFFSLGAAAEHRDFTLADCASCSGASGAVPPPGVAFGSSLKTGYDDRWIGVRAGAEAWQNWASSTSTNATWMWFPEVSLRLGRLDGFRAEFGCGSYGASTILRPGLWAGVAYVPDPGWEIVLHGGGVVTTGVGYGGGARGDLLVKLPVTRELQLGLGAALTQGLTSADPEGQMMLIAHVW